MRRKLGYGLLALGTTAGLLAGPVGADPKQEIIPVTCDNGNTYDLAVNGNGEFTPGHDVDSNTVLIPVAFGTFTGIIRNAAGAQVGDPIVEEGAEKGQSGKKAETVTCTVSFSFTNTGTETEDGVPPGGTFTGSGTVIARVVGH